MNRILAVLFVFIMCVPIFAARLIDGSEDEIVYVSSVRAEEFGSGSFVNMKPKGKQCGIIVKYQKDFSQRIISVFGGDDECVFYDAAKDQNGDFIVMGVASASAFGTGDLKGLKSFGGRDIIFVRYDKNLRIKDVQNFGSLGDDWAGNITVNSFGKIVIAGKSYFEEEGLTKAFAAIFDKKFSAEHVTEFKGSFKSKDDAVYTEFSKIKECADGTYIILGHSVYSLKEDIFPEKALVVKTNYNLKIYQKESFGTKNSIVHFSDIAEKNEGGYVLVGYADEDMQKGYISELDYALKKVFAYNYMPVYKGIKAEGNGLFAAEPVKDKFFVKGIASFGSGNSVVYYTEYISGKPFKNVQMLSDMGDVSFALCDEKSLYGVGYDNNRLIPVKFEDIK